MEEDNGIVFSSGSNKPQNIGNRVPIWGGGAVNPDMEDIKPIVVAPPQPPEEDIWTKLKRSIGDLWDSAFGDTAAELTQRSMFQKRLDEIRNGGGDIGISPDMFNLGQTYKDSEVLSGYQNRKLSLVPINEKTYNVFRTYQDANGQTQVENAPIGQVSNGKYSAFDYKRSPMEQVLGDSWGTIKNLVPIANPIFTALIPEVEAVSKAISPNISEEEWQKYARSKKSGTLQGFADVQNPIEKGMFTVMRGVKALGGGSTNEIANPEKYAQGDDSYTTSKQWGQTGADLAAMAGAAIATGGALAPEFAATIPGMATIGAGASAPNFLNNVEDLASGRRNARATAALTMLDVAANTLGMKIGANIMQNATTTQGMKIAKDIFYNGLIMGVYTGAQVGIEAKATGDGTVDPKEMIKQMGIQMLLGMGMAGLGKFGEFKNAIKEGGLGSTDAQIKMGRDFMNNYRVGMEPEEIKVRMAQEIYPDRDIKSMDDVDAKLKAELDKTYNVGKKVSEPIIRNWQQEIDNLNTEAGFKKAQDLYYKEVPVQEGKLATPDEIINYAKQKIDAKYGIEDPNIRYQAKAEAEAQAAPPPEEEVIAGKPIGPDPEVLNQELDQVFNQFNSDLGGEASPGNLATHLKKAGVVFRDENGKVIARPGKLTMDDIRRNLMDPENYAKFQGVHEQYFGKVQPPTSAENLTPEESLDALHNMATQAEKPNQVEVNQHFENFVRKSAESKTPQQIIDDLAGIPGANKEKAINIYNNIARRHGLPEYNPVQMPEGYPKGVPEQGTPMEQVVPKETPQQEIPQQPTSADLAAEEIKRQDAEQKAQIIKQKADETDIFLSREQPKTNASAQKLVQEVDNLLDARISDEARLAELEKFVIDDNHAWEKEQFGTTGKVPDDVVSTLRLADMTDSALKLGAGEKPSLMDRSVIDAAYNGEISIGDKSHATAGVKQALKDLLETRRAQREAVKVEEQNKAVAEQAKVQEQQQKDLVKQQSEAEKVATEKQVNEQPTITKLAEEPQVETQPIVDQQAETIPGESMQEVSTAVEPKPQEVVQEAPTQEVAPEVKPETKIYDDAHATLQAAEDFRSNHRAENNQKESLAVTGEVKKAQTALSNAMYLGGESNIKRPVGPNGEMQTVRLSHKWSVPQEIEWQEKQIIDLIGERLTGNKSVKIKEISRRQGELDRLKAKLPEIEQATKNLQEALKKKEPVQIDPKELQKLQRNAKIAIRDYAHATGMESIAHNLSASELDAVATKASDAVTKLNELVGGDGLAAPEMQATKKIYDKANTWHEESATATDKKAYAYNRQNLLDIGEVDKSLPKQLQSGVDYTKYEGKTKGLSEQSKKRTEQVNAEESKLVDKIWKTRQIEGENISRKVADGYLTKTAEKYGVEVPEKYDDASRLMTLEEIKKQSGSGKEVSLYNQMEKTLESGRSKEITRFGENEMENSAKVSGDLNESKMDEIDNLTAKDIWKKTEETSVPEVDHHEAYKAIEANQKEGISPSETLSGINAKAKEELISDIQRLNETIQADPKVRTTLKSLIDRYTKKATDPAGREALYSVLVNEDHPEINKLLDKHPGLRSTAIYSNAIGLVMGTIGLGLDKLDDDNWLKKFAPYFGLAATALIAGVYGVKTMRTLGMNSGMLARIKQGIVNTGVKSMRSFKGGVHDKLTASIDAAAKNVDPRRVKVQVAAENKPHEVFNTYARAKEAIKAQVNKIKGHRQYLYASDEARRSIYREKQVINKSDLTEAQKEQKYAEMDKPEYIKNRISEVSKVKDKKYIDEAYKVYKLRDAEWGELAKFTKEAEAYRLSGKSYDEWKADHGERMAEVDAKMAEWDDHIGALDDEEALLLKQINKAKKDGNTNKVELLKSDLGDLREEIKGLEDQNPYQKQFERLVAEGNLIKDVGDKELFAKKMSHIPTDIQNDSYKWFIKPMGYDINTWHKFESAGWEHNSDHPNTYRSSLAKAKQDLGIYEKDGKYYAVNKIDGLGRITKASKPYEVDLSKAPDTPMNPDVRGRYLGNEATIHTLLSFARTEGKLKGLAPDVVAAIQEKAALAHQDAMLDPTSIDKRNQAEMFSSILKAIDGEPSMQAQDILLKALDQIQKGAYTFASDMHAYQGYFTKSTRPSKNLRDMEAYQESLAHAHLTTMRKAGLLREGGKVVLEAGNKFDDKFAAEMMHQIGRLERLPDNPEAAYFGKVNVAGYRFDIGKAIENIMGVDAGLVLFGVKSMVKNTLFGSTATWSHLMHSGYGAGEATMRILGAKGKQLQILAQDMASGGTKLMNKITNGIIKEYHPEYYKDPLLKELYEKASLSGVFSESIKNYLNVRGKLSQLQSKLLAGIGYSEGLVRVEGWHAAIQAMLKDMPFDKFVKSGLGKTHAEYVEFLTGKSASSVALSQGLYDRANMPDKTNMFDKIPIVRTWLQFMKPGINSWGNQFETIGRMFYSSGPERRSAFLAGASMLALAWVLGAENRAGIGDLFKGLNATQSWFQKSDDPTIMKRAWTDRVWNDVVYPKLISAGMSDDMAQRLGRSLRYGLASELTGVNFSADDTFSSSITPFIVSRISNAFSEAGKGDKNFGEKLAAILYKQFEIPIVTNAIRAGQQVVEGQKLDKQGNPTGQKFDMLDALKFVAGGKPLKDYAADDRVRDWVNPVESRREKEDFIEKLISTQGIDVLEGGSKMHKEEAKAKIPSKNVFDARLIKTKSYDIFNSDKFQSAIETSNKALEKYIEKQKQTIFKYLKGRSTAEIEGANREMDSFVKQVEGAVDKYYTGIAVSRAMNYGRINKGYAAQYVPSSNEDDLMFISQFPFDKQGYGFAVTKIRKKIQSIMKANAE